MHGLPNLKICSILLADAWFFFKWIYLSIKWRQLTPEIVVSFCQEVMIA